MQRINRIQPNMPVTSYKTYSINAPLSTHWRPATCEEVDCLNYLNGWIIGVHPGTEIGQKQMHLIKTSGRAYTLIDVDEARVRWPDVAGGFPAGMLVYHFKEGQQCFLPHQARVERQEIFSVRGGDWRGVTSEPRIHSRPADWVEDFSEHQERLKTAIERG